MRLDAAFAGWLDAGWPAWAGALALLGAGLLGGVLAPRWRSDADLRLQQLAQSVRSPGPARVVAAPPPVWPDADAAPQRLAQILARAQRQGVSLPRLQQRLDANGHLLLNVQARASYPALRAWVEQALAADPALALDGLQLRRDNAATAEVDAELQWTLVQGSAKARP